MNQEIYIKKNEYYRYELKGVIIQKGKYEGEHHYISIIKLNNNKWYQFDDSIVKEFDINDLEKECLGKIKEDKENRDYILFYELPKKKPIKILLNGNEVDIINKNDKSNIIEYNYNNLEEIKNEKDEEEILNKLFHNNDEKIFFKYYSYDDLEKNVNKEYFLEVLEDNKSYDYMNENFINFDNNLLQIMVELIEDDSFNIQEELSFKEHKDLIDIFLKLIISYINYDDSENNKNKKYIKNINIIISKIFLPLFNKANQSNQLYPEEYNQIILNFIYEKLFSINNIKLLFSGNFIKDISEKIYDLFKALIKKNKINENIKLIYSLNKIIKEETNISPYLYKILLELIQIDINDKDEKNNIICESFLTLFYKLYQENSIEINKILEFLITKKDILLKKIYQEK